MNKIGGTVKTIKNTIIDKTSDVLSAPTRAYYGAKSAQSGRDADALKLARGYKGAPSFDSSGAPSDALKARTAADEVRSRLTGK
jgi:hypothetical protein